VAWPRAWRGSRRLSATGIAGPGGQERSYSGGPRSVPSVAEERSPSLRAGGRCRRERRGLRQGCGGHRRNPSVLIREVPRAEHPTSLFPVPSTSRCLRIRPRLLRSADTSRRPRSRRLRDLHLSVVKGLTASALTSARNRPRGAGMILVSARVRRASPVPRVPLCPSLHTMYTSESSVRTHTTRPPPPPSARTPCRGGRSAPCPPRWQ
jgi:hypothetical protein